jgi:hypothetical membrane protein
METRFDFRGTSRIATRSKRIQEQRPWIGPCLFILSATYFYAQIVVAWVYRSSYSVVTNTISDLGRTDCPSSRIGAHIVFQCSPRHLVMNIAFGFLGAFMAGGSMLLYAEFSGRKRKAERVAAFAGFSLMSLAGLGTILVGLFPENTVSYMHTTGAGLAIGAGNIGILVLGAVLDLPEAMRRYMLVFSTISVTALILFASHRYFGIGAGTMERVAAYPETVWLITFGLYIWRYHYKPNRRCTAL